MGNQGLFKNIKKYLNEKKFKKSLKNSGLDESKFNTEQLIQIKMGLEDGLNVSYYINSELSSNQMRIIREGLYKGLDVSKYADSKYNYEQMFQIYRGLEDDINVNYYANPEFSSLQMDLIRYSIYDDLDVSKFADPKYNYKQMLQMYHNILREIEEPLEISIIDKMKNTLDELLDKDYDSFIKAIISIEKGIDDKGLLDTIYDKYNRYDFNLLNDHFDEIIYDEIKRIEREKAKNSYFLETPLGQIPFTKEQNDFYNNLNDIKLLEYYLDEKENSGGFISPETFQVMLDRGLVFKGELEKDVRERLEKLRIEIEEDWEVEL